MRIEWRGGSQGREIRRDRRSCGTRQFRIFRTALAVRDEKRDGAVSVRARGGSAWIRGAAGGGT